MEGDAGVTDTGPDARGGAKAENPGADAADLARDWIAIWESELSALATDPETLRSWQAAAQVWSGFVLWMLNAIPKAPPFADDGPPRHARAGQAPGAAPVDAAPDPRDDEIGRLSRHIASLERRLADLERRDRRGTPSHSKRGSKRGL